MGLSRLVLGFEFGACLTEGCSEEARQILMARVKELTQSSYRAAVHQRGRVVSCMPLREAAYCSLAFARGYEKRTLSVWRIPDTTESL